jgi:lipopolysaccharide/colanic/teichoic acid biosynthesis glycosyltransferase
MDLFIIFLALPVLLPVFLTVMLILRLTGDKEVFYLQTRIGHRNRPFRIWKFATMQCNSEKKGTGSLTIRNDPRVTPVGRYLRKTKINELPQIFNVLTGEMSIVGPRPQMDVDFRAFPRDVRGVIYNVKPGVTGIGSIIFRDEEELFSQSDMPPQEYFEKHIMPYKGAVELWYQQQASLLTDLKIIFLTAWVIVFPKSTLYYRIFPDLPRPSGYLQPDVAFPEQRSRRRESVSSA